jgi:cytochrome c556
MLMRNKFGRGVVLAAFVAGLIGAPLLAAAADSPADIIKNRIAGLRELGAAFKNVNDELKTSKPNTYLIQIFSRQIQDGAKNIPLWFPAGTGPETGEKTKARPEIWQHPDQFKAAQEAFATQAASFAQVASSGDVDKIRAQTKDLGKACGSCHHDFRTEDKH